MIQVESAFNGNENGFSIAKRELELCLNLEPDPTLRGKALELLRTWLGIINPQVLLTNCNPAMNNFRTRETIQLSH